MDELAILPVAPKNNQQVCEIAKALAVNLFYVYGKDSS
jgi:hypothetical protein